MTDYPEHIHDRIERYLLGQMDAQEKSVFEAEMARDADLAKEVAFQRDVIDAISYARKEDLKARLRQNLREERRVSPMWLAAAAMIALVITAAWFFNRPGSRMEKPTADVVQYSPPAINAPEQSLALSTDSVPPAKDTQGAVALNQPQGFAVNSKAEEAPDTQSLAYAEEAKEAPADNAGAPPAEEYYKPSSITPNGTTLSSTPMRTENYSLTPTYDIKTDILLKDSVMPVFALVTPLKSSMTDTTANGDLEQKKTEVQQNRKKANSESKDKGYTFKLPADATAEPDGIQVHYWQSPVNYKGYKYFRNSLDLYGITPADKIQLIRWDGNLYLKNNKKLYKLTEQNDYSNFVPLKDRNTLSNFGL